MDKCKVFIPKAGKKDYALPKSFRPISLTSFLLKTMEKIIDKYIREEVLTKNPISSNQHAYCSGKSTETALLCLIDRVEKALQDKQIALCAFLDIEGAFDNTPIYSLIRGLTTKNVDATTIKWIEAMLSTRTIKLSLHGTNHEVVTTRGCPQGGVLSPLLWTLTVDQILRKMEELRIDTQGYADDLVIVVRGFCQSTISYLMQKALSAIHNWCKDNELRINADKTVIVPFTRKKRLDKLVQPSLNARTISFSSEVKYLGVIIDQRLTWNKQIDATIQKAKIAMGICGRLAGKRWGLNPKLITWLYTAVVRPIITYARVLWCRKANQSTVRAHLATVQRMASILATGAMSTSPGAALEAMLNITLLHLHVKKVAMLTMHKMYVQGRMQWTSLSLRSLLDSVIETPVLGMTSDMMTTETN